MARSCPYRRTDSWLANGCNVVRVQTVDATEAASQAGLMSALSYIETLADFGLFLLEVKQQEINI